MYFRGGRKDEEQEIRLQEPLAQSEFQKMRLKSINKRTLRYYYFPRTIMQGSWSEEVKKKEALNLK